MGRPAGAKNVTPDEVDEIRRLYRAGEKIDDIVEQVGRSTSVVERAVRGLSRKKPKRRSGIHAERNDRILAMVAEGYTRAEVGEAFGLTARQVSGIVIAHPTVVHLLRVRKLKPATVARRYRMDLSTAIRIATGRRVKRARDWGGRGQ